MHILSIWTILLPLILTSVSCRKTGAEAFSQVDDLGSGGRQFQGEGRWTSYGREQNGQGSCGRFADYAGDPKKWIALSEKFLVEQLGFKGCENDPSGQRPPQCWMIKSRSGQSLCGTRLQVRCEDRSGRGLCASSGWFEGVLVDVCPADRSYHDRADPNSRGDYGCRDRYIADLDESIQAAMTKRFDNPELIIKVGSSSGEPDGPRDPLDRIGTDPRPIGGACTDISPDRRYTCAQQKGWGKCGDAFMRGFCNRTCGRCSPQEAGEPIPRPGICSDIPPDWRHSCRQQAQWGKCGEPFMRGFCQRSCRRC